MVEVLQCDNCGHNKICALKQIKNDIAATMKNSIQILDNPDITVSISCKYFTSTDGPWSFTPKGRLKNNG